MTQTKGAILLAMNGEMGDSWHAFLSSASKDRKSVRAPVEQGDPSIDYAVAWAPKPGLLASLPNLKAIFSVGAGVDHLFRDPDLPDVPIVRVVAQDLTNRMSEYVVWRVLDHHRQGDLYRRQQTQRLWGEDLDQPVAADITVGILGLGALGQDAARKLRVLGFQVAGWSRSATASITTTGTPQPANRSTKSAVVTAAAGAPSAIMKSMRGFGWAGSTGR